MNSPPKTPLLDTVEYPSDLRQLEQGQLRQLSDELRAEMIDAVSTSGGHLGSGLGVVELTVAIHYVFDTPNDKLVWDVGHQCYPHKIITGRRDRIRTLRQGGGLSGFTKRSESEYDPFGAAHSSTSISAALGFAMANRMQDKPGRGIAVIGDGVNDVPALKRSRIAIAPAEASQMARAVADIVMVRWVPSIVTPNSVGFSVFSKDFLRCFNRPCWADAKSSNLI